MAAQSNNLSGLTPGGRAAIFAGINAGGDVHISSISSGISNERRILYVN